MSLPPAEQTSVVSSVPAAKNELQGDMRTTLDELVAVTCKAQEVYSTFTQEQVDEVFTAVSLKLLDSRYELAELSVKDSRFGRLEDRVLKCHCLVESCFNAYINEKTVGVVEENSATGTQKIAEPKGTICGVVPCTNPVATTAFYIQLALKTRNGIVFCPHPRTFNTSKETCRVAMEAAAAAGAPPNLLTCVPKVSVAATQYLMRHRSISLIAATGGDAMVFSAYSSGNPAIGVGAGNAPIIVDQGADLVRAISDICLDKLFDNGVPCTTESNILLHESIYDECLRLFVERGGYVLPKAENSKLRDFCFPNGSTNPSIVGLSAIEIAKMTGISVPQKTLIIGAEVDKVGPEEPISHEKASPILGFLKWKTFDEALAYATATCEYGGNGHTAGLHTGGSKMSDHSQRFSSHIKCTNLLINAPTTLGVAGGSYTFDAEPCWSKACGSWGKNITCGGLNLTHMLNYKLVQTRQQDLFWFRVPKNIVLGNSAIQALKTQLKEDQSIMKKKRKIVIVTDKDLVKAGVLKRLTDILDSETLTNNLSWTVFDDILPDPDFESVQRGVEFMKLHEPDIVIALGGGSPMDAAKIMRLLYECPEADCHSMTLRFLNVRRRTYRFPRLASNPNKKTSLICIPTTSGTGSEITPFAVVTSPKDSRKYPVGDYELLADTAIVDASLAESMPRGLAAATGMDALTHGIETFVSPLVTEFTRGLALESVRMIMKYLPASCDKDSEYHSLAREKVHNGASIACMAVGQALVGVAHSLAHAVGGLHHISHGILCSIFLPHAIVFNSSVSPPGIAMHSNLKDARRTRKRFDAMAVDLGISGESDSIRIEKFVRAVEAVSASIGVPKTLAEVLVGVGISEAKFHEDLDKLVKGAFDDSCTLTNPRLPLLTELKKLYQNAFYGTRERLIDDDDHDIKVSSSETLISIEDIVQKKSQDYVSLNIPEKIYFRPACTRNALDDVRQSKKVAIVASPLTLREGHVTPIFTRLAELGVSYEMYTETTKEEGCTLLESAVKARDFFSVCQPDDIIAVGGSTTIDLVKLARIAFDYKIAKYDDINDVLGHPATHKRVRKTNLIAIGTTLELTSCSPYCSSVPCKSAIPDCVIYDSVVLEKSSKAEIARGAGLILISSLEALLSDNVSDFSVGLGIEALRLTLKYFESAITSEMDEESISKRNRAREKLQLASSLIGIVVDQSSGFGVSRALGTAIENKKAATSAATANLVDGDVERAMIEAFPLLLKFSCRNVDEKCAKILRVIAHRLNIADENELVAKVFEFLSTATKSCKSSSSSLSTTATVAKNEEEYRQLIADISELMLGMSSGSLLSVADKQVLESIVRYIFFPH